jgi:hypothetical protein
VALSAGILATFLSESASAAVLPALLARTTVVAALQFAAKKGMAVGAATTSVVALAEGVCRMMTLVKLKVIALLLFAVGVLGGGAGLLANRAADEALAVQQPVEAQPPPEAQKPPAVKPPPKQADKRNPPETDPVDLRTAAHEVERVEEIIRRNERLWDKELLHAQMEVLIKDEELQSLERKQRTQREHEDAEVQVAHKNLNDARASADAAVEQTSPDSPLRRFRSEQRTKAQAEVTRLEELIPAHEGDRTRSLIKARFDLLVAQNNVRQIERRQARERARLEADLEIADERVRQTRWDSGRAATEKRTGVERKLDRLLREVEELRRELRHDRGSEGRPTSEKRS